MTIKTAVAYAKISACGVGKPFYAADFNLNGGEIKALKFNGFISKTGRSKTYYIDIDEKHAIKGESFEWCIRNKRAEKYARSKVQELYQDCQTLISIMEQWGK